MNFMHDYNKTVVAGKKRYSARECKNVHKRIIMQDKSRTILRAENFGNKVTGKTRVKVSGSNS